MKSGILGRDDLIDSLAGSILAGHTELMYGPFGIGKTTTLREVQRIVCRAGELAHKVPPEPLLEADLATLLEMAHGRPGWIVMFVERLADSRYWREGRILLEVLFADISIAVTDSYRAAVNLRERRLGR